MTQKIVISERHGGFGLSGKAIEKLKEMGVEVEDEDGYAIERDNPQLVQVVQEMGKAASGGYADLKIIEIPDDVKWEIGEYDGFEWVAEQHRVWDSEGQR